MSDDEQAILALLKGRDAAIRAGDARTAVAATAAGAVRYDLDPPLAHVHHHDTAVADLDGWFANWDGPITLTFDPRSVRVSGDLAVAYGFARLHGVSKAAGAHDSWFRSTIVLDRGPDGWRIVHEHNSYPMLMDGSGLAATGLQPE